jgi:uncharacterized phiE125 gp8 family phage protein
MAMMFKAVAPLDAEKALPLRLLLQHLKDPQDDELLVDAARQGALGWIETHVGLSLSLRAWRLMIGPADAPASSTIRLPMGPVAEVTKITYAGVGAEIREWPAESWGLLGNEVLTRSGLSWRTGFAGLGCTIDYVAGYADLGREAPALRTAAMLLAAHFYRNREENAAQVLSSMPFGVKMLCEPLRMPVIA